MTFGRFVEALGPEENWRPAITRLGRYLDAADFHGMAKYFASVQWYFLSPSVFSAKNPGAIALAERFARESRGECRLAVCLAGRASFSVGELGTREKELATDLERLGLVSLEGGVLAPGDMQLASLDGLYILLDAAIHFPVGRMHEIYIGPDSLLLSYYRGDSPRQGGKALDLCSGSGVVGLGMARACGNAVCTDLSPTAQTLIRVNAVLNRLDDAVRIRDENLTDSLESDKTFDCITCNPPFVAMPRDLARPLFAAGPGADGLDYLRLLLEKSPAKLAPEGRALFVADLPGNDKGPYFLREAREIAARRGIRIDMFVDGRVPAPAQSAALTGYLQKFHPDVAAVDIQEKVDAVIRGTLRASFYYLTVFCLWRDSGSGVRVFNRFVPAAAP